MHRNLRKTIAVLLIIILIAGCATSESAISPEPTRQADATATPVQTAFVPEPTAEPTPTATPAPTTFSIVWISDTQNLSRLRPDVMNCMRDWILKERESRGIAFVIHTGDVVDGCSQFMWDNAAEALVPVFEAIPGMVVSGNHDISKAEVHSAFYERPYARAVQKDGQIFENGKAAYQVFTACGETFLVIGIGYNVRGQKLRTWIDETVDAYPDATVLLVLHAGLQPNDRFTGQARELFLDTVTNHPNVRLLLCGHQRGALLHTELLDDDGDGEPERPFYTLMYNFQDDMEDGLGFLRILTFDTERRCIEVETYSPWYDAFGYAKAEPDENAFVLENAF